MEALEQPESARSAFQARIRQLQRIGLQKKPDSKAYERLSYGLVELAALATAFRLMAAFMLPIVAVRYVTECWADFLPGLVAGLGPDHGSSRWDEGQPFDASFVAIEGVALARLGQKAAGDTRYDGPLGQVSCHPENDVLGALWSETTPQGILFDTRPYMSALIAKLATLDTVSEEQLADEIDRLRFSAR